MGVKHLHAQASYEAPLVINVVGVMITTSMTTKQENNPAETGEILKVDVLGRVTVPKEKREELLDTFEASGMSGAQFAQHHGIHVQTFASWIQKRRRARGDYESEEMRSKLRMRRKSKKNTGT